MTIASTQQINQSVKFRARPQDIYEVLTSESVLSNMTQSKVVLQAKKGGSFSYFDGQITGTFKELIPNEKMRCAWRMKEWEDGVFSDVVIKLYSDEYGVTTLELHQVGIPQADKYGHHSIAAKVADGWEMHFWDRIKKFCGFEHRD